MSIVEVSPTQGYEVKVSDYEGKTYMCLTKMWRKKGEQEWKRTRFFINFPYNGESDLNVIRGIFKAMKQEILANKPA